jgi:hypothetical protein
MAKPVLAVAVAVVLAVVGVGLWAFQPWKVFTSSEVDEPLPSVGVDRVSTEGPAATPAPGETTPPADTAPVALGQGEFVDAEHDTSGLALVLELADGSRFLRLENLASSDGPDLHVWMTDQPSGGDWGSYDDGDYLRLGELKATHGNQNYEIPAGADLAGFTSVVIWCDRFNVAFGTAPITLG